MSHDTDKLIRQLSLVAFLMAERRAITARDVKSNVEGYSEMSDEAFARRFYSDRAELLSLGVPLQSQRDEFTGEELYTLRSEQYFLPQLELEDEELAALQTAFYLLEGKFAYAEPLRLALQNLALGRPGFVESPTETAERVEVLDPDYSPEMPGRLAKLENAISKQRTVKFEYWSISRDKVSERTLNPYALLQDNAAWYVVGHDLDRDDIRTFRVSRIRGDIKFATRRERDFRAPSEFDIEQYRGRPPWQIGDIVGSARIEVRGDTAWWVRRTYGSTGTLEDDVFVTDYSSLPQLASWVLRQNGRAVPLEPAELRREVATALRHVREAHEGAPPSPAREKAVRGGDGVAERPAGPVAPERFAVLQALLAYLLAACGEEREAEIPAPELLERFPSIPPEELEEHLSLLNLVNFGGGCYTVYAELRDGSVHVDKELWGDTFRAAPRLTPLEARAIRLALEYVGPMIAADAHTPLARVRKKLEETFGQFELARTPEPHVGTEEVDLVSTLARGMRERRVVEIEYQKEVDAAPSTRLVEPYSFGRELPNWYVHTWDRTSDGERSFRLDRMRSATLTKERFEPRPGFEPTKLRNARTAVILYARDVARFATERGARLLTDGTALAERPYGDEDWLESEILAGRGDAVLLEPHELRGTIAARARTLAKELGVERMRVR
ncbi:MAG TPA: WYL domain-containing protein, partial [Gaiellaceae bacterium]|nr:WYL domain-containing protein [Gaiellaceae bacterium]